MTKAYINNQPFEAHSGETILEFVRRVQTEEIPYHVSR